MFGNTFLAVNSTSFVLYYAVPAKVSAKREVEIKLRISDIEDILRRIRKLGAESLGRVLEQNSLFDTPNSGFRRSRRLLRLRRQTPAPGHGMRGGPHLAILTSKAPPAIPRRTVPKSRIYKEVQENQKQLGKAGNEAFRASIEKSTQPGMMGGPDQTQGFGATTAL